MSLKDLQHKEFDQTASYKGIPIMCAPQIHEKIFASFLELNLEKNSKLLVLGSGAGAFEQRLIDNNYKNITSVEFVPENFIVKGTNFLSLDLNQDFFDLGEFDVIFAIEIIEHLENQFHFMRCVRAILKKQGVLYLTTPNVESTFARLKYCFFGKLHYFGKGELTGTGHINPIFKHILEFNLSENNLKIENYFTNANVWKGLMNYKNLKIRMAYIIMFFISRLLINKNDYEINLFKIVHK